MIEVINKIYYVGVNDRNKERFEGLWPLPNGISYNSFLIVDKKVCLVDTVEVDFFVQFMEKLHDVLGDRKIDYLVINHMEPDHSGSLALIKKYYPDIQIVGNKKTFGMMEGFYNLKGSVEVTTGSVLNLGEHVLRFILTPMVHWPETMMTVCTDQKGTTSVFSGDAFGSYGALNGGIIDSEIDMDAFHLETARYYSNIVGKYGVPVQSALKKLSTLKIDYICSTHGPVWHEQIARIITLYDRLSRYDTDKGIVICYGTMYGNTERMAEIIARSASQNGIKNIVMYNICKTDHSYILRDVFRFNGLIVGAPTYNAGLYHEMDVLLAELANKNIKNHYLGWFGSHCWASKAVARIKEWNDNRLHFTPVGTPVDMTQGLSPETVVQCEALGKAMADQLNSLHC